MTHALPLALALLGLADPPPAIDVVAALESATTKAIARAQPSVVSITRTKADNSEKTLAIRGMTPPPVERERPFVGGGFVDPTERPADPFVQAAPGDYSAGVVIGDAGEILTTYHTLIGSRSIFVRGVNRVEFEAEILAADPRSDLAVIAPRASTDRPPPKLTPIALGDASRLRPGSFLIGLGNSYNAARDGKASASWGILANTTRKLHTFGEDASTRRQYFRYQPTLLQLDTKLNIGMSGGAVIDMRGELVGLTTAAASPVAYDVQAGYAIPMDALGRRIADTLRDGREVEYGFFGIGLKLNAPNVIDNVGPGTPASRADLQQDDTILAVGDRELAEDDDLTMALANVPLGRPVRIKILRAGKVLEKQILVSKYPVAGPVIATNRPKPWRGLRVDFTSVLNGSGGFEQTMLMEAMGRGGVGIVEVEPGSSADSANLRKGFVITHVDGVSVTTPADFTREVSTRDGKDVTLTTLPGPGPSRPVIVHK